jgi:hypothetical protein
MPHSGFESAIEIYTADNYQTGLRTHDHCDQEQLPVTSFSQTATCEWADAQECHQFVITTCISGVEKMLISTPASGH